LLCAGGSQQQVSQFWDELGIGGTQDRYAEGELPVVEGDLHAPHEGDTPRNASEDSTRTSKIVVPAVRPVAAPWKPRAIRPADRAPRKMLARPLASPIVAARCVCRLKCSVVSRVIQPGLAYPASLRRRAA
jgi:hypothetical protein